MLKAILSICSICLLFANAKSQSVGLVLSGGGAKGMAHIEVIRVLEEHNIPIDYIAGTSIGAIVGGLYAAGYSTDEMEELFRSDEFYFWSTGKIQKEYRYYFTRPEPNPSWLELRIEKQEDKLKLLPPTNIIPEEQMNFAFMELTAPTTAICQNNFDSLMVPFFCIATDIHNNQPVILRKGDLGDAIRASMTVPLYFKPIMIDNKVLFDGGIVNNFPHDIMKELYNPDIIIGHKVSERQKIPDADNVVEQITNMVMRPTDYNIPEEQGILMETKFHNVGLLDFQKYDLISYYGRETALKFIDSIKVRVERRVRKEVVHKKRQDFNAKKPEMLFQNIQVEGIQDPMQRRFIIQSIKHRYDIVSLSSLKQDYFKLIANEHLQSIRPIALFNKETGMFDLHLKVKPEKKVRINIGGNISTKPINQGFASFDYRSYQNRAYTISSNIYFGRFYSSFKAGARIDFPSTLPFYLAGYTTFNRWDFFSSSSELFFEDVRPPFIIQDENNVRLEAGIPLGRHSKLYSDLLFVNSSDEYYQTEIFKKEDDPDNTSFNALVSEIAVENNSLNYKQFATEGSFNSLSFKYITGRETNIPGTTALDPNETKNNHNYFLAKASTLRYWRLGPKFAFGTQAEMVLSNKEPLNNYRSTLLSAPGYYPTPHSNSLFIENFHSNNYLAGGLKAIFNMNRLFNLRVEGHAFVPFKEEIQNPDLTVGRNPNLIENYYLQGMAALVHHSALGPISIALNYYEKPNTNFYLTLNFGYILFNKRGL